MPARVGFLTPTLLAATRITARSTGAAKGLTDEDITALVAHIRAMKK